MEALVTKCAAAGTQQCHLNKQSKSKQRRRHLVDWADMEEEHNNTEKPAPSPEASTDELHAEQRAAIDWADEGLRAVEAAVYGKIAEPGDTATPPPKPF